MIRFFSRVLLALFMLCGVVLVGWADGQADPLAPIQAAMQAQRYGEAEAALTKLLAAQEAAEGPTDVALIPLLLQRATCYQAQKVPAKAETDLLRAVSIDDQQPAPQPQRLSNTLVRLNSFYLSQQAYPKCVATLQRLMDVTKKAQGDTDPMVTTLTQQLASCQVAQRQFDEAAKTLSTLLAQQEAQFGKDDSRLLAVLGQLADGWIAAQKYPEAQGVVARMLAIGQQAYGVEDAHILPIAGRLLPIYRGQQDTVKLLDTQQKLATLAAKNPALPMGEVQGYFFQWADGCRAAGKLADASAIYPQLLTITEARCGAADAALLPVLLAQSEDAGRTGHPDDAAKASQRALTIGEKTFGVGDPRLLPVLSRLALLAITTKDDPTAQTLTTRIATLGPAQPAVVPSVVSALEGIATAYQSQKRFPEAQAVLTQAVARGEQAYGANDVKLLPTLRRQCALALAQPALDTADALSTRILSISEAAYGKTHVALIPALYDRAEVLASQKKADETEAVLQRALAIAEQAGGAQAVSAQARLAAWYATHKAPAKAEALYKREIATLEATKGKDDLTLCGPLLTLAQHYVTARQAPEAIAALQRITAIADHAPTLDPLGGAQLRLQVVDAFTALGRYDNAAALLKVAQTAVEGVKGLEDPALLPVLARAVTLAHLQGRTEEETVVKKRMAALQTPTH